MIDFYELLGIKRDATKEEIQSAYRHMAKKYHPDVNKSEEASRIILSLNEAKETLLDESKRGEYDQLLNEIEHAKQFSKDSDETYHAKAREYRETYSDTYITKWQFLIHYLKNGLDYVFIKIFKVFLVLIIYLFFFCLKAVSLVFIFLLHLIGGLVDYFAGFMILIAILSLFVLAGKENPDYIPFIPANVESFCMFSILGVLIELLKQFILDGSLNLIAFLQNIEDNIFIFILMK